MGAHHRRHDTEYEPLPLDDTDLPPIPEYVEADHSENGVEVHSYEDLPPIPEYVEDVSDDDIAEEKETAPPIPDYLTPEEEEKADAREAASESRRTWVRSVAEFIGLIAIALIVSVVVKTFFIQAFFVPSGSMETTLNPSDRILVNRLADSPEDIERGDIIVFSDPNDWLHTSATDTEDKGFFARFMETIGLLPASSGQHLVKRVIGVGGDTVACCDAQGRLTVNGVAIDETYLDPGVAPSEFEFSATVPHGQLWVMGDNRSNSNDSRQHQMMDGNGYVPTSRVVGRAWAVFWPYSEAHIIESGRDVFKNVPDAQ